MPSKVLSSFSWLYRYGPGFQGLQLRIAGIKTSELGGPSGKLFRFVSCVRARGAYVRSDLGENLGSASFPFPFSPREVFPFPSALQGPIQLQLALSVFLFLTLFDPYIFSEWVCDPIQDDNITKFPWPTPHAADPSLCSMSFLVLVGMT